MTEKERTVQLPPTSPITPMNPQRVLRLHLRNLFLHAHRSSLSLLPSIRREGFLPGEWAADAVALVTAALTPREGEEGV
jgi:hypothetical protein